MHASWLDAFGLSQKNVSLQAQKAVEFGPNQSFDCFLPSQNFDWILPCFELCCIVQR